MPTVRFPALLRAAYHATVAHGKNAPTLWLPVDSTVFHYFPQEFFVVDTHRHILRRDHAMKTMTIYNQHNDAYRYTGQPHCHGIESQGGLYCSLQQQAIVNEAAFYVEAERVKEAAAKGLPPPKPLPRTAVLNSKAAIKIRLLGPMIAAEISPHSPDAEKHLRAIAADKVVATELKAARKSARPVWDLLNDPDDCSFARGLGLGLARFYDALCAQTARTSERSPLERGDNLIFFGRQGTIPQNLSPVEAYLFPVVGPLKVYPVEF